MRRGRFGRKQFVRSSVPTAAMANIAFLLLMFYVATSVLKLEGLAVTRSRDPITRVRLDGGGRISIDGRPVPVDRVEEIVKGMLLARPHLTVAFDADDRAPYPEVSNVLEKLEHASAVRLSSGDRPPAGETRSRD